MDEKDCWFVNLAAISINQDSHVRRDLESLTLNLCCFFLSAEAANFYIAIHATRILTSSTTRR